MGRSRRSSPQNFLALIKVCEQKLLTAKLAKNRKGRKEPPCLEACGKLVELRARHAEFSETDRLVG